MTWPIGLARRPARIALAVGRLGLDDAAAGPAERERRPDDRRQADRRERLVGRGVALRLGRALDDDARRVRLADPVEQVAERLAVLGHPDRLERRAEEADRVALEDAGLGHRGRQVERGLAAEPGQQALRPLPGDDRLDRLDRQRLEVDDVRDGRVGHDRGRVRVDEDRPDALGAQRAAGLRAGVVELGRLADDDRARPEDQDGRRLRGTAAVVDRGRASRRSHGGHEPVEHRERVERARRALGVVLDGLDRLLAVAQALDRAVVEVDLADAEARRRRQRVADDLDLVVLGRHLDDARAPTSWTGWFAPWWPNRSRVVSAPAARPTIWWPRQMPSSGRPSSMIACARATGPSSRAGSPGPGDRIRPSMSRSEGDRGRDRVREDPDPGAAVAHRADDVRLQSEVDDPDQRAAVLRTTRRP